MNCTYFYWAIIQINDNCLLLRHTHLYTNTQNTFSVWQLLLFCWFVVVYSTILSLFEPQLQHTSAHWNVSLSNENERRLTFICLLLFLHTDRLVLNNCTVLPDRTNFYSVATFIFFNNIRKYFKLFSKIQI